MPHKKTDLTNLYEKAMWEPLTRSEIGELSVSSRCALIRKMLDTKFGSVKGEDVYGMVKLSLERLSSCFEISADFHKWQNQRRKLFTSRLLRDENSSILEGFADWTHLTLPEKQTVLKDSVQLHVDAYLKGVLPILPYSYEFKEGGVRKSSKGLSYIFGGFSGNVQTGEARIVQYMLDGRLPVTAKEAFDTAHHETTHLIQHHLAVAYHRHQISMADPLYKDAAYFHAVDVRKSHIPVSEGDAYSSQPHEVLANWEGGSISAIMESLAH